MQLRALLKDEKAVSPVIGVILMVAITVILAAVIGTFVLGLGDQVRQNPPQASFTFDYNELSSVGTDDVHCGGGASSADGALNITHDGGDKVTASDLSTKGSSEVSSSNEAWDACSDGSSDPYGANSDITAGNELTIGVQSDDTVRVVWNAGSDNSATLGRWTGPDA